MCNNGRGMFFETLKSKESAHRPERKFGISGFNKIGSVCTEGAHQVD